MLDASKSDPVLQKYADVIKDFGYLTNDISWYQGPTAKVEWSDRANLRRHSINTNALSPSELLSETLDYEFYD